MNKKNIILLSAGLLALSAAQGVFAAQPNASAAFNVNANVNGDLFIRCAGGGTCQGNTITFNNFDPVLTNTQTVQTTFATNEIAAPATAVMSYIITAPGNTFQLSDATNDHITYNLFYKDCAQNTLPGNTVAPSVVVALSAEQSSEALGTKTGCFNDTATVAAGALANAGAGALTIQIPPPASPPPAGNYSQTFTVTACDSATACP